MSTERPGENGGFAHEWRYTNLEPTPNAGPDIDLGILDLPTDDWAHPFFHAYLGPLALGTLSKAAAHAGVHPNAVKRRLADDTLFRELKQQADTALIEALEMVAYDRAYNGVLKPIIQHGEVITHVREIDNRLLQWLLERLAPEKYHLPTRIEHVAPDSPGAFSFQLGDKPRILELDAGE
jgi:hypothetical protein